MKELLPFWSLMIFSWSCALLLAGLVGFFIVWVGQLYCQFANVWADMAARESVVGIAAVLAILVGLGLLVVGTVISIEASDVF